MLSESAAPVRGALFYSVCIITLMFVSMLAGSGLFSTGLAQVLVFAGITVGFTFYYERGQLVQTLRLRLLSKTGVLKSVIVGLLAWAMAMLMGVVISNLVERLGGEIPAQHEALMKVPFLVALLVGAILPAVCEELAFRGYLLGRLGPLGGRTAILLTGLLFGATHMTMILLLPLALLGMIFATAVHRSGSILPGMIMHFLNNAVALILTFFLPSAALDRMGLGAPNPSLSLVLAAVVGVAVLGWVLFRLVRTFGPQDLAGAQNVQAPPAVNPLPLGFVLVPLIPAGLIYLYFGVFGELYTVFIAHR
jgi:membrane protease YdiL (CAAX protease family)